jgi:hypothetical protein
MQRANGDWFAIEDRERLHVPIFRTHQEAMKALTRNPDLVCFRPVLLDERALPGLVTIGGEPASFWLINDAARALHRGSPLNFAEFERLMRNHSDKQQGAK